MENKQYHSIRLGRAWKEYVKLLRSHIMFEFIFIGAGTIANIFVATKYVKILTALSYEFLFLLIAFAVSFLWKSLRVAPESIYKEQQNIIDSKKKAIDDLKKQQEPKLQIVFDENKNGYIYDLPGDYGQEIGIQISERIIRIRVNNLSKYQAVEGVEVMLTDIDKCKPEEKGKLPVHLKLRNDANNRESFTIPADGYKFFEVIHASFVPDKRKMCEFRICHIERRDNYTEIPLQFNAENTDYKIKIEVKSNTTLCEPKYFIIGLKDKVIKMQEASDAISF